MPADRSPTVRRRRLGIELRALRESKNLTLDQVAAQVHPSAATISRIETGRGRVSLRDVEALLRVYEVDDDTGRVLLDMARESRQPGWWVIYDDVLPRWAEVYIGLEAAATAIQTYEVQLVHGLLQTPDYARALLDAGQRFDRDETNRRVKLRMQRQQILTGDDPTDLWVVLDEAALRRPIGGTRVMQGQLKHLVEASRSRNVTVQVIPFDVGAHRGMLGPYTVLTFADNPNEPNLVYRELGDASLYLEKPAEYGRFIARFGSLQAVALSPEQSVEFIAGIAE